MRNYIDLINEMSNAPEVFNDGVPELGARFSHQGRSYAVCGWFKEFRDPKVFGKRGGKLVACVHSEATWILGLGGGGPGCLLPINEVQIRGTVNWTEEQRKKVVDSAMSQINAKTMFTKPQ